MREILLAFILALIIGSIINGWPRQPVKPSSQEAPKNTGAETSSAPAGLHKSRPYGRSTSGFFQTLILFRP